MKKILLFLIFFYFLALLESSFFIHFRSLDSFPSLILISQVLITLLEDPKRKAAFFSAFIGGFFWDVFSEHPIGFGITILVFLSFLIKIILKQYVRIPILRRF